MTKILFPFIVSVYNNTEKLTFSQSGIRFWKYGIFRTLHQLGKVLGSFSYGYMMSQIIGGFLADRFGQGLKMRHITENSPFQKKIKYLTLERGAIVLSYCGVVWSFLTILTPIFVRHSSSPDMAMMMKRIALGVSQGLHYPCKFFLI